MRTSHRLLALTVVLAFGASIFAATTANGREARPTLRAVSRSVVHAGPAGPAQDRPTSFDVFSSVERAPATIQSPTASRDAAAPDTFFGFDALADLDGFQPSDTVGAVGDSVIVTAVNSSFGVFSPVDGSVLVPRTGLDSIIGDPGLLHFDPKVVYDPYDDMFLVAWLGFDNAPQQSFIFTLAIPDATATDLGTWCATSFSGDQVAGDGAQWADYPGLGYNASRVTITTNQFTFANAFRYSQVMTIDKVGLYDCNQPVPTPVVFAGSETKDKNGIQAFTMQPAQTVGNGSGGQLLVSFQLMNGKSDYHTIWRIKPTASGLALKKGTVPTGKVSLPPPGTQGGGGVSNADLYWDAGDERLVNVFYDGDRDELYTAHAVLKNFTPDAITGGYDEAAIRWYEIDPATKLGDSVIVRKGLIGDPEADVGWPTVATDGDGNLFVTYSRASAPLGEFLSAWVAEIPPGSTADTQQLMQSGFATYDAAAGIERWGDYTGINRDPSSPDVVVTFNQYALDAFSWQQVVNVVTHV
jgi:hypothetical protein